MGKMTELMLHVHAYLIAAVDDHRRDERGDVPGWVLVTVMTVTIAMGLWAVAEPQLTEMLRSALNSVK